MQLWLRLSDGATLVNTGPEADIDYAILQQFLRDGSKGRLRPFPEKLPEVRVLAFSLNGLDWEPLYAALPANRSGPCESDDRRGSPGGI